MLKFEEFILQSKLCIYFLDFVRIGFVLDAIVFIEDSHICRRGHFEGFDNKPGTCILLDIGTYLACDFRIAKRIQKVILGLEKMTNFETYLLCRIIAFLIGDLGKSHSQGDRQIKGIMGGLILVNPRKRVIRKAIQLHLIRLAGRQVEQLADLGSARNILKEVDQVDINGRVAKVLAKEAVNHALEHERVVNGVEPDLRESKKAGLAATRDGGIHDVIGDEEEGLEQLDAPAEDVSGALFVGLGGVALAEGFVAMRHGQAAVELAVRDVVLEVVADVFEGVFREVELVTQLGHDLVDELREGGLEIGL